jgi:hypothetical protein
MGLMGASPSATHGIGHYVVCDVRDLACCGRRLYNVLLGIRLTSFKNGTPTSVSLNRNAMDNLLAAPLGQTLSA